MKRISLAATAAMLLLALLAGCPEYPAAPPTVVEPETPAEPVDTIEPVDTAAVAGEPAPAEPEPKPEPAVAPEPAPEPPPPPPPPPRPKALPRMWAFGADRCIPCVQMRPFLTELVDEYAGRVEVKRLDVYQDRQEASQARIQMIPTQIFYDSEGKEVFRHVGFYEKDSIIAKFRAFGWE